MNAICTRLSGVVLIFLLHLRCGRRFCRARRRRRLVGTAAMLLHSSQRGKSAVHGGGGHGREDRDCSSRGRMRVVVVLLQFENHWRLAAGVEDFFAICCQVYLGVSQLSRI